MDSVPTYIVVGAILGIISTIVLLITHLRELVATIRSFINWVCRCLREWRVMFREWRWWKQYCPSCEIANTNKLRITKIDNEYNMEIQIEVRYTSRDKRHDTLMDISSILLDVYNTGKGRDSEPYRLSRSGYTTKISPIKEDGNGGHPVMGHAWRLPCGEEWVLRYPFHGSINAPPLVGTSAFCKIVATGKAQVEGISVSKQLGTCSKFPVGVLRRSIQEGKIIDGEKRKTT